MKTLEISNAKARTLAEYLTPQWARLAIKIACSNVEVNTPFRHPGETADSPAFKRRVASAKADLAALGEVLAGLGATLPKVDRAAIVVPYKSPRFPRRKYSMVSTQREAVERKRLIDAVLAGIE